MPPDQEHNQDPLHPANPGGSSPGQEQQQPSPPLSNGMKVIQPLDPNLKVDNTPAPPAQPNPATQQEQTADATDTQSPNATTQPPQPIANPSSIYPDVTKGLGATNYSAPSPTDNIKDESKATTFSDGYSIGGTIFWYQLIAGIVFGLIFYGLTLSVLKTSSTSLAAIVGLLHYVVEYLVLLYIPYSVLKSNAVEEPLWLTLFGVASQTVIVAAAFELVDLIIIKSVINHGVSSSLTHIGGSGLAATANIVYIGFLIASYFLTKLSWGVAFSLFGKIANKVIVKAIGIGVIAIIVGGIAYHYLTLPSKNSLSRSANINTSSVSGLTSYNVNSSPSFSVNFFKGSAVTTVQGQQLLIRSEANGQQAYIYVKTATTPTTSCTFSTTPTFSFYVQGAKGLGCYGSSGSDGYVQVNGQNYDIGLRDDINVSQQTTEAIFNSVSIN